MEALSSFFSQNWIILVVVGSLLLFIVPWLFVWSFRRSRRELLANGRPTPAKIIKLWDTGLTIGSSSSSSNGSNNGGSMRGIGLLLEVYPQGEEAYQVKIREQLHLLDISRIAPGMMLEVRVDLNKPNKVAVSQWGTTSS